MLSAGSWCVSICFEFFPQRSTHIGSQLPFSSRMSSQHIALIIWIVTMFLCFSSFPSCKKASSIYIYTGFLGAKHTHTHRCSQFDRLGAPKLEYMQMAHSLFVEQLACGFSCLIRMQQNKSDRVILNTSNAC